MKILSWNCDGLGESKIKWIRNLCDTLGLHGVCLQECRRDLRTDDSIRHLVTYFPAEEWKYEYSRGEKTLAGTAGQGLLTLIHRAKVDDFSVEITPHVNNQKMLRLNTVQLSAGNQSYALNHFFPTPGKLDQNFKSAVENADVSSGDLNKMRSSYPIRHVNCQKFLAEFDLVELLKTNTHIPRRRGATVATTDPDSVISSYCHSESVEMVSRETLRPDHLAYNIRSDFNWPSREPEPPKFGGSGTIFNTGSSFHPGLRTCHLSMPTSLRTKYGRKNFVTSHIFVRFRRKADCQIKLIEKQIRHRII